MKNLVPRPAQLSRNGKRLVRDWMGSDGKSFRLPLNTNKNAKSSIVDIYGEAFTSVVGKNPTMKVDDYGKSIRPYNNKLEPATTKSNLFRSVGRWKPDLESDKPLDVSSLASISVSADRKRVIDAFTKGKISKEEYEERLKKLGRSPAIVSVKNSKGEHVYAKNVKYSADSKKGGLYLPQSPDEPRQVIATLKGKKKTNIDPDTKEPAGYIKTAKGRKPVYETLGIGFSQTPFLLCDFYAGHPDHVSIPTKQWSQIPVGLQKKIRTVEKKKQGDLKGVYQQAREYADFAQVAGVDKLNTTKAKTVKYNGASYRISEPSRTQRKGKKYQVTVERSDGRKKTVAWGDSSREDYLVHKDKKRRDNFQKRFAGIKKKDGSLAKNDPFGSSFYAVRYNW